MKKVATYCYQCVAGPDLLTVKVADGVAKEVEPNFAAADVHPGGGKVCVKAYGLVQKTYHPDRVLRPMKRTNPKKGHGEDPGFVPISWEEALETICAKLADVRSRGLVDESGMDQRQRRAPRRAADGGIETVRRDADLLRVAGDRPVLPQMQFNSVQEALHDGARQRFGLAQHRPRKAPGRDKEQGEEVA